MSNADSKEAATAIARDTYGADYKHEKGPTGQLHVIRLAAEHCWLILAVHHGVADEITLIVMLRDPASFYNSIVTGQPAQLPELSIQDTNRPQFREVPFAFAFAFAPCVRDFSRPQMPCPVPGRADFQTADQSKAVSPAHAPHKCYHALRYNAGDDYYQGLVVPREYKPKSSGFTMPDLSSKYKATFRCL